MPYYYSDPAREHDPHALPNIEIWYTHKLHKGISGYFYAFGFPGCLHDGDPVGPFTTEQEALDDARKGLDE